MVEHSERDPLFFTVSMAEILLSQNLTDETRRVLARLEECEPENPRVRDLARRLEEITALGEPEPVGLEPRGADMVELTLDRGLVRLSWEVTEQGLEIARKKAVYSGRNIVRLFTAAPGPRGVRTSTRDIEIGLPAARMDLCGLQHPAVHVAAVGFLANTGAFVPVGHSEPLVVEW